MGHIKNISLFFITIFLLFSVPSIYGQYDFDLKTDSLINKGIEFSIQHQYAEAENIFQHIIKNNPEHPIGYFFMAATIQSKMMDYETDLWADDFQHYIDLTIKLADAKIDAAIEPDCLAMFFKGSALSYVAFYEGRKGNYLSAVRHGLAGMSILKKIAKFQPDFNDVYFGIGSYKYWRSQMTRFLNWLPLIPDEREIGIALVKRAIAQGKFTRYVAMNELTWILLDAGEKEQAFHWARQGLSKFPRSRFFLWGAAKSALALNDFNAATVYFEMLLNSIVNASPNNHYNEYICRVKLAHCYLELGSYGEAKTQLEALASLPLSARIAKRLKSPRKQAAQLNRQLSDLMLTNRTENQLPPKDKFTNEQRRQQAGKVTN